ncbi:MAG: hypothetical protein LC740_06760 [Actinobacteria bacterium]|nr:hypothetical protein [Actinomycetota bacterium]
MRAVCNTDVFGKKLAMVSRGVSARSTIQLLGGILLEAEDSSVRLSATDMELSIQTSSPAEVEEGGRVVVPARIFNDVVRSLPGGELSLAHDRSEGVVRLSARENEYRIRAYAAEDFPQLPKFDEAVAFKMSGEALLLARSVSDGDLALLATVPDRAHAHLRAGEVRSPENDLRVVRGTGCGAGDGE